MESPRWKIITPSKFEWERRGLDFIRKGLPDHDPYRAWSNFEFQAGDGAIYEVDLLVLTKQGFWLVECKAWGGRITGDTGSWTRIEDGKVRSEDNPVLLANRKAKALSSLLKAQSALTKVKVPWLDALVFLSADEVQCELTGAARNRVCLKDRPAEGNRPERKGIIAALLNRVCQGVDADLRSTIDTPVAKALSRAMEQAGIQTVLREPAVGAAVAVGENRLAPVLIADCGEPRGDCFYRLFPAHSAKFSSSLRTRADRGKQKPIGSVHEFGKVSDFAANEAGCQRVHVVAVERLDPAVANRDVQATAIGAVERTGTLACFDVRFRHEASPRFA